jgi:hypothetical protein
LSCVLMTQTGFGLVIGFINHIQVVTTNKYNTVPDLHHLQTTATYTLGFTDSTSRLPTTDLTQKLPQSHTPNITRKSVLLITRQFFAAWPLLSFCAPSPNSHSCLHTSAATVIHS